MSGWRKFWMKKPIWWGGLVLGPAMFNGGMKMIGVGLGEPITTVTGFVIAFVGLLFIWAPFNAFKDSYEEVRQEFDYHRMTSRSSGRGQRASQNAWVDDDDIDGDGVGGDSLTRMGINSRHD